LLEFALERSDAFECAIPYPYVVHDFANAPLWPTELQPLDSDVVTRFASTIRWDLIQDYATQFVRFRSTPALRRYIRSVGSLEAWSWEKGTPEDPTFLVGDSVILSTESTSGRIAVYASRTDVADLSDVGIHLIEPLGVKAEPWPTP
jgi:hypothetical protein